MSLETDFELLQTSPSTIGQRIGFWTFGFFASFSIAGGLTLLCLNLFNGGGSSGNNGYAWLYVLPLSYIVAIIGVSLLFGKVRHRAQSILVANIALLFISFPAFYMAFQLL